MMEVEALHKIYLKNAQLSSESYPYSVASNPIKMLSDYGVELNESPYSCASTKSDADRPFWTADLISKEDS